jgi:hypothetical protein
MEQGSLVRVRMDHINKAFIGGKNNDISKPVVKDVSFNV